MKETIGDDACPFNTLYWDFLIKRYDRFTQKPRMALILNHVTQMETSKAHEIVKAASVLRDRIRKTGSERPPSIQNNQERFLDQKSLF